MPIYYVLFVGGVKKGDGVVEVEEVEVEKMTRKDLRKWLVGRRDDVLGHTQPDALEGYYLRSRDHYKLFDGVIDDLVSVDFDGTVDTSSKHAILKDGVRTIYLGCTAPAAPVPTRSVRGYLLQPLPEFNFGPAQPSSTRSTSASGDKQSTFRTLKKVVEYTLGDLEVDFPDDGGLGESTMATLPDVDHGPDLPGDEYYVELLLNTQVFPRFTRLEWFKSNGCKINGRPTKSCGVDCGFTLTNGTVKLPIEVKKQAALPATLTPNMEWWVNKGWGSSHSNNHIEQIYGYMNVTRCKWGLLITYPYMYVVKRVDDEAREVAVTKAIKDCEMLVWLYRMCRKLVDADVEAFLPESPEKNNIYHGMEDEDVETDDRKRDPDWSES